MSLTISLGGVDDAVANMRRVAASVGDEEMTRAGLIALEPIAETARELAPARRGILRDSIVVVDNIPEAPAEYNRRAVFVGPLLPSGFHGGFVELGTVNMPAEAFLGPATDAREGDVFEILGEELGRAILSVVP